jgi:hypothetical protein
MLMSILWQKLAFRNEMRLAALSLKRTLALTSCNLRLAHQKDLNDKRKEPQHVVVDRAKWIALLFSLFTPAFFDH